MLNVSLFAVACLVIAHPLRPRLCDEVHVFADLEEAVVSAPIRGIGPEYIEEQLAHPALFARAVLVAAEFPLEDEPVVDVH